jgi:Mn-dependent DtxR family transcriptional regulator
MLKELLQEIAEGQGYSRAGLARRLDISEDALEQMLHDLARKGYLAPLTSTQKTSCSGCSLR